MHDLNRPQKPSRSRRALEVLAVVGGTYGAYRLVQLVQQLRARQQSATDASLPRASHVMSPTVSPSLGEHSEWLESFRTEQVRRLRSDPPAA